MNTKQLAEQGITTTELFKRYEVHFCMDDCLCKNKWFNEKDIAPLLADNVSLRETNLLQAKEIERLQKENDYFKTTFHTLDDAFREFELKMPFIVIAIIKEALRKSDEDKESFSGNSKSTKAVPSDRKRGKI